MRFKSVDFRINANLIVDDSNYTHLYLNPLQFFHEQEILPVDRAVVVMVVVMVVVSACYIF